jgi:hypothetical protein
MNRACIDYTEWERTVGEARIKNFFEEIVLELRTGTPNVTAILMDMRRSGYRLREQQRKEAQK